MDHNVLIKKLKVLSVDPFLVSWVTSFLCDRKQRVKLGSVFSSWVTLNGGIPQGSWLGPILFIVFVNDLLDGVPCIKYMDDTTVYEHIGRDRFSGLQSTLDLAVDWTNVNHMVINTSKSVEMLVSCKRIKSNFDPLSINDNLIDNVSSFKLLGVNICNDLSWQVQVDTMVSKGNTRLYFLKRLRRSGLCIPGMIRYYNTVIRPVLEYAAPVWGTCLSETNKFNVELWG